MKTLLYLILMLTSNYAGAATGESAHQHTAMPDTPECKTKANEGMLRCSPVMNATFDQDGRLWLVWVNDEYIFVNHSDDKGMTYSQPVRVNKKPEAVAALGENRTKIKLDKAGRIFLSWTIKLPQRYSGHIRFSRSVDGGMTFSEPMTVNDHILPTSHRFESFVVNDKGEIYIAWLDKRDMLLAKKQGRDYVGAALYYATSTDHGQTFSVNQKLADHSCECCRTAAALDPDQSPVFFWRHIYPLHTRDHALIKLRSDGHQGTPIRVSHDGWKVQACPHHGPDLNISIDGNYHAVWFNNAEIRHGLFYAHSDDQGQHFSEPLAFGDYQKQASHPAVYSSGQNVYLVWQEFDGTIHSLMTQASGDRGVTWEKPRVLSRHVGAVDYPMLLSDRGRVYVYWHIPGEPLKLLRLEQDKP